MNMYELGGLPFPEVIARSRSSPRVEEKDFDLSIFRAADGLKRKYGLKFDPAHAVPDDDAMSDRLFAAAKEFYATVGTYCVSSGRVIRFTAEEIEQALADAPDRYEEGQGAEHHVAVHRGVEDSEPPTVHAGIQTVMLSDDDMAFGLYRACAADLSVEGIWGGVVPKTSDGRELMAGTPLEISAYRRQVEIMRQAVAAAGRPGLVIVNNAPRAAGTIALFDEERGLRRSDHINSEGVAEMKIGYDDLDRTAFGLAAAIPIKAGTGGASLSGYGGSPEGVAIVATAGALQALMVNRGVQVAIATTPFKVRSRATLEGIWTECLSLQALSRNTHLVIGGGNGDHPAAGPGTKQYFYETAAGFISVIVGGGNQTAGTRKFVIGNTLNYGSPLESRWMGEVCKSAAGMTRRQANEIVQYLWPKYKDTLKEPPAGFTYEQLHDAAAGRPCQWYLDMYGEVKRELAGLGFAIKSWSI